MLMIGRFLVSFTEWWMKGNELCVWRISHKSLFLSLENISELWLFSHCVRQHNVGRIHEHFHFALAFNQRSLLRCDLIQRCFRVDLHYSWWARIRLNHVFTLQSIYLAIYLAMIETTWITYFPWIENIEWIVTRVRNKSRLIAIKSFSAINN